MSNSLPSISVVMPTLNAEKVIEKSLVSISGQNYPRNKVEIIIADGGSTDRTVEIAKKFKAKIFFNPLKTGEAGKAVGLRHARNDLVALIDSDNVLPSVTWFKEMVKPFADAEIIGSEPWEFTYRKEDGFIDRYCALMGLNDPLCFFLGNYDRWNTLTGTWTGLPVQQTDKSGWIKLILRPPHIPTIGANGTILRRRVLSESGLVGDYLFDVDVIAHLAGKKSVQFAKVKTGIIHLFCGSDVGKFAKKQKRRIRDYLFYERTGVRGYPWRRQDKARLLMFILFCVTILPLFSQAAKGYAKRKDTAWFFHPIACWITLWIYGWGRVRGLFTTTGMDRRNWSQ